MIIDWLLFPLVMLAVCVGCGLTVERIAGWRLWGGLLPALGLVLVIVVASLTTNQAVTVWLTTPLVVFLAIVGYATSLERLRGWRPEPWALAVGLALFAAYAAPFVLSGNAGFAGYFIDNDAAIHFALIDRFLTHGPDIAGLPTSAYAAVLNSYISTSYPVGADVALGAIRPLVGQDVAWVYQPYLALVLTFGGVLLYELLRDAVRPAALRAAIAFIAGQAGLLYAAYLETSIKELLTTMIITLTVVLVFATLRRRLTVRSLFPLALTAIAALDVLELAAVPWIGIPLAVFVVVIAWRTRHRVWMRSRRTPPRRTSSRGRLAAPWIAGAIILGVLLVPFAERASTSFAVATGVLTNGSDLGNLVSPLPKWQMFGIWPVGDFRFPVVAHYQLIYALIGVAIASALVAVSWMIRRRRLAPLLMVAGGGIATAYLLSRGNGYASAKVMMIFSLTAVLASMLGAAALYESGRRVEAWGLAAVLAAGVLWTNVLGLENASIAPRQRFDELKAIGARFSGQGPALYNLSDEFAVHFLRNEAPADPAFGGFLPRKGLPPRTPAQGRFPWDPNDLEPSYLQSFKLLVLGNSPVASRPPANFKLVFQGRYYSVWRRVAAPAVLAHVPVSSGLDPTVPKCASVRAVAAQAMRENGLVAYAPRSATATMIPSKAAFPPGWVVSGDPNALIPVKPGAVVGQVRIARPGRYQVWLNGSFDVRYTVWVGGRLIGSTPLDNGPPGQYVRVGEVTLSAGEQPVFIIRPATGLFPGKNATPHLLGPLVLVPSDSPPAVGEVAPAKAPALCGRPLQWLEVVRPGATLG